MFVIMSYKPFVVRNYAQTPILVFVFNKNKYTKSQN